MTHTTPTDAALVLAGIIRQTDPRNDLTPERLADAILGHVGSRWGPAVPPSAASTDFKQLLNPEPGFELVYDDGDPERLPHDAQQWAGEWWQPRFGSDSLATTLDAIRDRLRATVPPTNVYFEFQVLDANYCVQAGGQAPTYLQALSEGQNYLAQYQQDGPHHLELRRVEILIPDALQYQREQVEAAPLPAGEGQS